LTPSMTVCGALPFISQTVSVPLSFTVFEVLLPLEQAAATSTRAVLKAVIKSFLGFI